MQSVALIRSRKGRHRTAAVLSVCLSAAIPAAAHAASPGSPGSQNPAFGTNGLTTLSFGQADSVFTDVLTAPDGSIYALGESGSSGLAFGGDLVVAKFHADGSPDTSFGTNGQAAVQLGGSGDELEPATEFIEPKFALAPDGDLVLEANVADENAQTTDIAVAELAPSGALDTAFDSNGSQPGVLLQPTNELSTVTGVAVQADGTILLSGGLSTDGTTEHPDVQALNPAGSAATLLDTSWGTGGYWTDASAGDGFAEASDIIIDSAGDPVVSLIGESSNAPSDAIGVERLTPEGQTDPSFTSTLVSAPGATESTAFPLTVAQLPDGDYALGGLFISEENNTENFQFLAAAFNAQGLDTSFGSAGDGFYTYDPDPTAEDEQNAVFSMNVESNGKLVLVGVSESANSDGSGSAQQAVIRLDENGIPDTTFGTDGVQLDSLGTVSDGVSGDSGGAEAVGSTLGSDGQLITAGGLFQLTGSDESSTAYLDGIILETAPATSTGTGGMPTGTTGTSPSSGAGTTTTATTVTTGTPAVTTTTPPVKPKITATLHSAAKKSAAGWYRTPVTVSFSCDTQGATLVGGCPKSVTLTLNAANQAVQRTIKTTAGQSATITVSHINIDRTAPTIAITGVSAGRAYTSAPAKVRCAASDHLSGISSCRLTRHVTQAKTGLDIETVRYTATAETKAGITATRSVTVQVLGIDMDGAPYRAGRFAVTAGHRYTITVLSPTRPTYIWAAPTPQPPSGSNGGFREVRPGVWQFTVTIEPGLFTHFDNWTLGVRIGGKVHQIHITKG